jgi:hypothetical protein
MNRMALKLKRVLLAPIGGATIPSTRHSGCLRKVMPATQEVAATLSLPLVKSLEEYALAQSDVPPGAASAVKSTTGGAAPAEGEAMPVDGEFMT